MCSVSCQKAFVATLQSSMAYIAVGSYLAFFVLIIVTFWNSQTHHGCWCIKPSSWGLVSSCKQRTRSTLANSMGGALT